MTEEKYIFSGRAKKTFWAMIIAGLVITAIYAVYAFISHDAALGNRVWSNILVNTYYFTGISIGGLFFMAAHQLGYSGWHTVVKRVWESIGAYVPYMAILALIITLGMWVDAHSLYHHWTHPAEGDIIVPDKLGYLNKGFFTFRLFVYYGLWCFFSWLIRKNSRKEDTLAFMDGYKKSKAIAALFLVVFAVSTSMVSWDMNMSLDPHWYSTLFGWYNFASYMCACMAFMLMIILYLKSRGYLKVVNENHIHDIAKYMFGFSVFWTYLWFSQYMLQWYSNIPEDTAWFIKRFDVPLFKYLMFAALIINFALPLLVLMSRGAKRNYGVIVVMCILIIGGHYLDFFGMMMFEPNAVHDHHGEAHDDHHTSAEADVVLFADNDVDHSHDDHGHEHDEECAHAHGDDAHGHDAHGEAKATNATLGLLELLIFGGFVGGFLLVVFTALTKQSLVPIKSPYLKESINHHI